MFKDCGSPKGLLQYPLGFRLSGLTIYMYFHTGHKERTQWWPFGTTLWGSFFLLIFVLIIVLYFAAGIKLRGTFFSKL